MSCARSSNRVSRIFITLYCSPHHQASALYPVINYYERLAGIAHDDAAARKARKAGNVVAFDGADLERTAPILATLLSIPPGDRYQPLRLTPEQLKEQTLQLLIGRVGDISLGNPVLCLIEDAHWIDPTSSELISRMILSSESVSGASGSDVSHTARQLRVATSDAFGASATRRDSTRVKLRNCCIM